MSGEALIPWGPPLANHERLRRVVMPEHMKRDLVSDFAFKNPVFSVERCALAKLEETLARKPMAACIAEFEVRAATEESFGAYDEPENGVAAHAHVYYHGSGSRKARAVALLERCSIMATDGSLVREPIRP